jgi:hypothetical protein
LNFVSESIKLKFWILLTFHELNAEVPDNEVHDKNISVTSVTALKIGASGAVTSMLLQPLNAAANIDQTILPQFLTLRTFNLSPVLLKNIRGNVPVIFMSYIPGVA